MCARCVLLRDRLVGLRFEFLARVEEKGIIVCFVLLPAYISFFAFCIKERVLLGGQGFGVPPGDLSSSS